MPTSVFAAEKGGSHIYRIGRVGYDTGTADSGGVFSAELKTERISPAGEDGLCFFRRVVLRVWHTGAYSLTMTVYVDDVQTKTFNSATGAPTPQTIVLSRVAPTTSPIESVVEASIWAQGTYITVDIVVQSDDITGVFLPETIECHYLPIRASKSRPTAKSS